MDIAVVDNEKVIREHICVLIEEQKPESRIEAYATGEELLASGMRFDIVFLDIHLKNILQRAIRTKAHSSMYIMLTISIAMFFVYTPCNPSL